jgi:hypothetical protein
MASRLTTVVVLVALLSACATPRVVHLDTGQGAPLEYRPASNFAHLSTARGCAPPTPATPRTPAGRA